MLRILLLFVIIILMYVPATGQVSGTNPSTFWRETDQALPAGLWRLRLNGDVLLVEKNTAANGSFSTVSEAARFIPTGVQATSVVSSSIGPSTGQQHTLPSVASGVITLLTATQTLTNKTISGAANTLSNIANASLTNSSVTVTAGTGLSGGGAVALGAAVTLNNAGVLSAIGTANQVNVSGSTGNVTFSLPQSIHTGATPSFTGLAMTTDNTADLGALGVRVRTGYFGTSVLTGDGTASAPSFAFAGSPTTTGFFRPAATTHIGISSGDGIERFRFAGEYFQFATSGLMSWGSPGGLQDLVVGRQAANVLSISDSGTDRHRFAPGYHHILGGTATLYLGDAADVALTRHSANSLALRNGTNPQNFIIYNTYANGGTDQERVDFLWSSNEFGIYTTRSGTGLNRPIYIVPSGANGWYFRNDNTFRPWDDNLSDIGDATHRLRSGYFGTSVVIGTTAGILQSSGGFLRFGGSGTVTWEAANGVLRPISDNTDALGGASNRVSVGYFGTSVVVGNTSISAGGAFVVPELASDAPAPAANYGVIYMRDNGSGKTQLVARFPTGTIQVLATEP